MPKDMIIIIYIYRSNKYFKDCKHKFYHCCIKKFSYVKTLILSLQIKMTYYMLQNRIAFQTDSSNYNTNIVSKQSWNAIY